LRASRPKKMPTSSWNLPRIGAGPGQRFIKASKLRAGARDILERR
jgi:hypothetical protein